MPLLMLGPPGECSNDWLPDHILHEPPNVAIVMAVDATGDCMKFLTGNGDGVMVSGSWYRYVMGQRSLSGS